MQINLDNENMQKQNELHKDIEIDNYNNFYNKKDYNTFLINIDSSFRNISPKNIYSSNVNFLPSDPLTTTINSPIIKINYPNHGFNVNDRLIIQNVIGLNYIVQEDMFLFETLPYLFIRIDHNITKEYVNLLQTIKITIQFNDVLNNNSNSVPLYYGNIPINLIIGTFDIILPSVIDNMPQFVLNNFGYSSALDMNSHFILIKLPLTFFAPNVSIYTISDFYNITFEHINGIPINNINSDYPVNYKQLQGYINITSIIDNNNFTINTNYNAINSGSGGGSKIQIMKILMIENGYPNANSYTIKLNKNLTNVVRIELISSEFPFIDYLVKSSGNNKNNMIYWKQLDDGNTVYSASVPEGNYDGNSIITILKNNMNAVPRIISTDEIPIYNIFDITYNSYTQEIVFNSYKNTNIPFGLKVDNVTINNISYFRLTVNHPNNLVRVNDVVTISNSLDIGIIKSQYINTSLVVYEVNIINQSYSILISTSNTVDKTNGLGTTFTDNGGPSTVIKTNAYVSLLFNYNDTIGTVLGFKNVGSTNAITQFTNSNSNFNPYVNDTNLNSVGNVVTTHNLLNFNGNNNYYLMKLNDFELITNNSTQDYVFAKILLSGNVGDVLYNTFINYPLEFTVPLSTLSELNIMITYGDGSLPDFRNINHSFTLRITELVNHPKNTGINSRQTNFLETMKTVYR